jgi:hypothetical protein
MDEKRDEVVSPGRAHFDSAAAVVSVLSIASIETSLLCVSPRTVFVCPRPTVFEEGILLADLLFGIEAATAFRQTTFQCASVNFFRRAAIAAAFPDGMSGSIRSPFEHCQASKTPTDQRNKTHVTDGLLPSARLR